MHPPRPEAQLTVCRVRLADAAHVHPLLKMIALRPELHAPLAMPVVEARRHAGARAVAVWRVRLAHSAHAHPLLVMLALRAHFDSPLADAVVVAGGDAGAGATCVGSSADKVEQGKRGKSDVIRQLRWLLRHV